jgi:hypothetical protein
MGRYRWLNTLLVSIAVATILVMIAYVINYGSLFTNGNAQVVVLLVWVNLLADILQIVISITERDKYQD